MEPEWARSLRESVKQLHLSVDNMQQSVHHMQESMDAITTRTYNIVHGVNSSIRPIMINGKKPKNWPDEDVRFVAFIQWSTDVIEPLLDEYGLDATGNRRQKLYRLANHLGIAEFL